MCRHLIIVLALLGFSAFPPAANAQVELPVRMLVMAGKYEEAREQLAEQAASNLEKAYYEGIILHRQGKYAEAAALFRRILNARPEQVLVRRELVKSLIALEDYEGAEYQIEQLIETDENQKNWPRYRAMQRSLQEKKPYGFNFFFALVPSTNINRGTTESVFSTGIGDFIIDESGKEESGVGVDLTFSGYRQFQLDSGARLRLNGSLSGRLYKEEDSNQYGIKAWVDYRKPIERGYWQVSPKYTLTYLGSEKLSNTKGLDFVWQRQTSPKNIWRYKVGGYYGDFYDADYRNGIYLDGYAQLRRKVTPSVTVVSELGLATGQAKAERFQYNKISASVDVYKSWESGWLTSIGFEADYRPFKGNFTAVDYARTDRGKELRFSVMNRNFTIRGATPRLTCSARDVASNVAFYDYSFEECSVQLTRRF